MEGLPSSGFQGDFQLSGAEDGWLQSMFLVGLLIASPIFASMAKSKVRKKTKQQRTSER
jgi:hypothetical protein